jgi:hypothetical protein
MIAGRLTPSGTVIEESIMQTLTRSLLVTATFLIGCATGGAASQFVQPAAAQSPRPPPGTPRWTYFCVKNDDAEEVRDIANRVGADGFELAASSLSGGADMSSPIWCFKRPY